MTKQFVNTTTLHMDTVGASGVNQVCPVRISSGSSFRRRINREHFDAGNFYYMRPVFSYYHYIYHVPVPIRRVKISLWCSPITYPGCQAITHRLLYSLL